MTSVYIPNAEPLIAVFGDIMLDYHVEGACYKIANEGPIPVVHMKTEKYGIGGCGNVLMNVFALGAKEAFLFSRIGQDENGTRLLSLLPSHTQHHMVCDSTFPTITKHRIYSDNKLVARYDKEQIVPITIEQENGVVEKFLQLINRKRLTSVLFSDYNKGFLTKSLCQRIIQLCLQHDIPTIVDPKMDYTKYIGCTVIKPNKMETKHIFKTDADLLPLETCHKRIHQLVECTLSVITLSGDGISAFRNDRTYRISETTKEVIDVTGAGDIVCSVLGVYYPYIQDTTMLISIANHLASISVSHIGSYTITQNDMIHTYQHIHNTKEIDISLLPSFPNKKVVFTNGCFDILHSAHVQLFQFCKQLGDIVVVGLNTDESIKRLKGNSRPIHSLQERVTILQSIEYIDFIIPFSDDTPIELIRTIRPHFLVKGGDYQKESIIGKEYAGEVVLFEYVPGKSTTNIIKQLRSNT